MARISKNAIVSTFTRYQDRAAPGWTLAAAVGLAAALTPGAGLAWYRVNVATMVFVVILAAGYGLECLVAARTGRRALGQVRTHAQDR